MRGDVRTSQVGPAVPVLPFGRPRRSADLSAGRQASWRPYNDRMTFLCLASYFKGNRFLERLKAEGCTVYLLTVASALQEKWARHACDDVFAVNNFHDRRGLINAVAYLMRTRKID